MSSVRPRILIVDDTPSNIEVLDGLLGETCEIFFATDGAEAVETALGEPPDLILLDVLMPGVDGFEVCARLKADPRTAPIPVIFVTALDQEAEEAKGLELGAIDFISKPFSAPVVRARVRNHLELKRQRDILAGLSYLDGLTGLANRRRFDQVLDTEWRRGIRSRAPLSLIMMDIDFFKNFNDAAGHLAGDDCLRTVAQALGGIIQRPGDLLTRYGGEEFACILSETAAPGALMVAERFQTALADRKLRHPDSSVSPLVTLSIGAATLVPTLEAQAQSLIEAADRALYAAKGAGRNRICSD